MKKIKIVFTLLTIFAYTLSAQNKSISIPMALEPKLNEDSYVIDAHDLLQKFNEVNGIDIKKLSEIPMLKKQTAWNFNVGSTKSWWASKFTDNTFYQVPSTCRAVGTNCYIFVADDMWGNRVTAEGVEAVRKAFDQSTPANPNKGVYQNNVEAFGNPPDIDNDPRIIILILDILDGYSGSGGYVAGYFHSLNQINHTNSNKSEIYYMDANPLPLNNSDGLATAISITAHEFQHMIHYNYDADEESFVNESMSMVAEVVNGYPLRSQIGSSGYNFETNYSLFNWRGNDDPKVLIDYSRAARYSLYLYEQFGPQILKGIVQSSFNGINGINAGINSVSPPTSRNFISILEDWFIANYLNDRNVDSRYGYTNPRALKVSSTIHENGNVNTTANGVYKYAAQYITYNKGEDLKFTFNNQGNTFIQAKAIKIGASQKAVENVSSGVTYSVPDFGSTFTEVTFVIYVIDQNVFPSTTNWSFTYSSTAKGAAVPTGPVEIAYDKSEPVGVYVLSVGDTVAVAFEGKAGMKLDSIKVALRNTAQMQGGIWRLRNSAPVVTGQRLAGPFTVAGITTPVYNSATQSYPIPYNNWVKVDLRSANIDASTAFSAAFVINGVYENSASPFNRVMHSELTGSTPMNSWTYLNNPSSETSPPGWYYIVNSERGTVSLYLIRAYVSSTVSGVKEEYELLPGTYALAQNYPNPFNPETAISYTLAAPQFVSVKIYDALGKEIRTLVNQEREAGSYKTNWNGTDDNGNLVSSGIYFYKINAGNFTQTKKMVLAK
ncbi:MAG: T9SS type A sorting domain-containing protein [Melioribacteraceae bacterium]|nr:T9SS type A sorting domain-containing protein [Melioribacteraceae bacterium]